MTRCRKCHDNSVEAPKGGKYTLSQMRRSILRRFSRAWRTTGPGGLDGLGVSSSRAGSVGLLSTARFRIRSGSLYHCRQQSILEGLTLSLIA